jgi:hypothetical protein
MLPSRLRMELTIARASNRLQLGSPALGAELPNIRYQAIAKLPAVIHVSG